MGEEEENNLVSWINSKPNAMEAVCDIEIIQQFSSWLCHYARKGNGEILKLGSILELFNTLFPSNTIFSGNKDQVWYTNL